MRILITGGSGFLGRALLAKWLDEHVCCVYSRSEARQAALDDHPNLRRFIGDVRDYDRLRRAMRGCDAVIHAAALKRIEVGRYNPDEMVKTNVLGTMHVIEAAQDVRVGRVVYTSTDKAWQPISPYGLTKALAEHMMLAANDMYGSRTRFSVTRYGNVMGSTGSVVPIWRQAKAAGMRAYITDSGATRFWMTIDQATQLVEDTLEMMPDTPAIPTLPAFRLGDLASAMNMFTYCAGLPPWEKLHEGLCEGNTRDRKSVV